MDRNKMQKMLDNSKQKIVMIWTIAILVSVSLLLLAITVSGQVILSLIVLTLVIAYCFYYDTKKKTRELIGKIICFIDPKVEYKKDGIQIKDLIVKSDLFPITDRYSYKSSDFIKREFENYTLMSADVYSYYVQSSGKNSRTVDVFKGRWVILTVKQKTFATKLVVREEGRIFKGRIDKKLKSVNTEGIVFNKKFNVYTDNELEMLKIIKPQQIFAIQKLEDNYNGKLAVGINYGYVHLAIFDKQDLFEISRIDKIEDVEKDLKSIYKKAEELYNIVK